jgi:acetolactate synthase-1/2/3 large subunit
MAVSPLPSKLTSGWNAPKHSALGVHPSGFASKSNLGELHISFDPPADYGMLAEAVGAWSAVVKDTKELEIALTQAVKKVQGGQCAVLNVSVKD